MRLKRPEEELLSEPEGEEVLVLEVLLSEVLRPGASRDSSPELLEPAGYRESPQV